MGQTRQQLKERLQAAGDWQDYVAQREQLVGEGLTPAQAREEALRRIDARPPRPRELRTADAQNGPAPTEDPNATTVEPSGPDFTRHVPNHAAAQWVAENIANAKVRPEDAPSGLAWGLLQWVRHTPANQATFWGSIWPKLLPTGAALRQRQDRDEQGPCPTCGREPEPVDEGTERCLGLIDKLLNEANEYAEVGTRVTDAWGNLSNEAKKTVLALIDAAPKSGKPASPRGGV